MINWLRVLQISKEILAIDEFNVNACVSQNIFKECLMLNKQLGGAIFERVVHIEGRQRDETDFF